MKKQKYIVFLGFSDFPYGLAEAQKIILISKSLLLSGNKVSVLSRNGTHLKKERPLLKAKGIYENIEYIYLSGSCLRNEKFLTRRLLEIKGKINEIFLLRKRKINKHLDYAILSTNNFSSILYYYVLAKLFGFKIILNYVEFYSAIKKNNSKLFKRVNAKLFDKYASSLSDGVFPISEFLINHLKKTSPNKKYLKIPVLTDFNRYNGIEKKYDQKYFLFCGDASYKEIIRFIIDSFKLLDNSLWSLFLVVNGRKNDVLDIQEYLKKQEQKDKIHLYSNLSEKELFSYYYNASALLIPLRPTLQDIARFPHKIGEYLASGNPVISTRIGEIDYYFKDGVNMLLAEKYDIYLFAEKMQFVINNKEESQKIGIAGKIVAIQHFNYHSFAEKINLFLS